MTHDDSHDTIAPALLTAYALGECDETERSTVEAYLNAHPAVREELEDTLRIGGLLSESFASELEAPPVLSLTDEQRNAIASVAENRPAPQLPCAVAQCGEPSRSARSAPPPLRRSLRLWVPLSMAAGLVLGLAVMHVILGSGARGTPEPHAEIIVAGATNAATSPPPAPAPAAGEALAADEPSLAAGETPLRPSVVLDPARETSPDAVTLAGNIENAPAIPGEPPRILAVPPPPVAADQIVSQMRFSESDPNGGKPLLDLEADYAFRSGSERFLRRPAPKRPQVASNTIQYIQEQHEGLLAPNAGTPVLDLTVDYARDGLDAYLRHALPDRPTVAYQNADYVLQRHGGLMAATGVNNCTYVADQHGGLLAPNVVTNGCLVMDRHGGLLAIDGTGTAVIPSPAESTGTRVTGLLVTPPDYVGGVNWSLEDTLRTQSGGVGSLTVGGEGRDIHGTLTRGASTACLSDLAAGGGLSPGLSSEPQYFFGLAGELHIGGEYTLGTLVPTAGIGDWDADGKGTYEAPGIVYKSGADSILDLTGVTSTYTSGTNIIGGKVKIASSDAVEPLAAVDVEALKEQARSRILESRFEEALQDVNQILRHDPQNAFAAQQQVLLANLVNVRRERRHRLALGAGDVYGCREIRGKISDNGPDMGNLILNSGGTLNGTREVTLLNRENDFSGDVTMGGGTLQIIAGAIPSATDLILNGGHATVAPPATGSGRRRDPLPWYDLLRYPSNWGSTGWAGEAGGAPVASDNDADQRAWERLNTRVPELDLHGVSLRDAMDSLRDITQANLHVKWLALQDAGIDENIEVENLKLTDVTARDALRALLDAISTQSGATEGDALAYVVEDGVVTISTAKDIARPTITRVYDVRGVMWQVPDFDELIRDLGAEAGPGVTVDSGLLFAAGHGSADVLSRSETGPFIDTTIATFSDGARLPSAQITQITLFGDDDDGCTRSERMDKIRRIIAQNVAPETWVPHGDIGAFSELSGQLVVTQTPRNHAAVASLLERVRQTRSLRQMRQQERPGAFVLCLATPAAELRMLLNTAVVHNDDVDAMRWQPAEAVRVPDPAARKRGEWIAGRLGELGAAARVDPAGRVIVERVPRPDSEGHQREAYAHIDENPFRPVTTEPVSTFSIDVDTASYSNVRRILGENRLPPPGAVRVEEIVNAFPYRYTPPPENADHPFAVHTAVARCPWNGGNRLVRVALKGREVSEDKRPPANLVFLLDTSGSMSSPDKLPLVKEAMRRLVQRLGEKDRVAIVTYAGNARVALESSPCHLRTPILTAIDALQSGGSTNGAGGIREAYRLAAEGFLKDGINRVILCTDGDFNVGVTSESELVRLIQEQAKGGVFLTLLGFGTGNLQDDRLEAIADKGNGHYHYIDSLDHADRILGTGLTGTLLTIAKDVKIQVEFNPARVSSYRLIGYENRALAREDFNNDRKDAGEIGAGHTVTALYEVVPADAPPPPDAPPAPDALRYQRPAGLSDAARSDELLTLKLRYKQPDGDTSILMEQPVKDGAGELTDCEFRMAAAAASFAMILRDSRHAGTFTLDAVDEMALSARTDADARPADWNAAVADFRTLVQKAKELLPGR